MSCTCMYMYSVYRQYDVMYVMNVIHVMYVMYAYMYMYPDRCLARHMQIKQLWLGAHTW